MLIQICLCFRVENEIPICLCH